MLQSIVRAKVSKLLSRHSGLEKPTEGSSATNTHFFLFAYHYAVEKAPNHFPKMQNYVALYGFLRTLTFISVLFFWCLFVHIIDGSFSTKVSVISLVFSALLSFTFYMAFIKFHRRFSLEVLMALSAVMEEKTR